MNFGIWVEKKLKTLNITVAKFERDINLAQHSLYRYSRGKANPRLDTFVKITCAIADITGQPRKKVILEAMKSTKAFRGLK